MTSTLSRQLQQLATPAATSIYEDRRKRQSILFDADKAATIDRESALALGANGLEELCDTDAAFEAYRERLFSDVAASVNRSTLTKKENAKLSKTIKRFLYHLLPHLRQRTALQCLEWLVYRFDIQKHEASTLLRLALLYHDDNIFVRILHIVDVERDPHVAQEFNWLTKAKANAITLPRETLFRRCRENVSFLNSVYTMLDEAIELIGAETVDAKLGILYTFIAQLSIGAVSEAAKIGGCVKIVEHLMPLAASLLDGEALNGLRASLMIITAMCQYVQLTENVTDGLIVKLLKSARSGHILPECTMALAIVCAQESVKKLPLKSTLKTLKHDAFMRALEDSARNAPTNVAKFASMTLRLLLENTYGNVAAVSRSLEKLTALCILDGRWARRVVRQLVDDYEANDDKKNSQLCQFGLQSFIRECMQKHNACAHMVNDSMKASIKKLFLKECGIDYNTFMLLFKKVSVAKSDTGKKRTVVDELLEGYAKRPRYEETVDNEIESSSDEGSDERTQENDEESEEPVNSVPEASPEPPKDPLTTLEETNPPVKRQQAFERIDASYCAQLDSLERRRLAAACLQELLNDDQDERLRENVTKLAISLSPVSVKVPDNDDVLIQRLLDIGTYAYCGNIQSIQAESLVCILRAWLPRVDEKVKQSIIVALRELLPFMYERHVDIVTAVCQDMSTLMSNITGATYAEAALTASECVRLCPLHTIALHASLIEAVCVTISSTLLSKKSSKKQKIDSASDTVALALVTTLRRLAQVTSNSTSRQTLSVLVKTFIQLFASNYQETLQDKSLAERAQSELMLLRKQVCAQPIRLGCDAILEVAKIVGNDKNAMAELYRIFVSHLAAQKQNRKTDALLGRYSYIVTFFTSGVRLCDDTDKGSVVREALCEAFVAYGLKLDESMLANLLTEMLKQCSGALEQKINEVVLLDAICFYAIGERLATKLDRLFILAARQFVTNAAQFLSITTDALQQKKLRQTSEVLLEKIMRVLISAANQNALLSFIADKEHERFYNAFTQVLQHAKHLSASTLQTLASLTAAYTAALHSTMTDDKHVAALHRTILMQTRNSNADVRLAALSCVETMYDKLGSDAASLMREAAKFLSELFEDANSKVERTAQALVKRLPSLVGESVKQHYVQ